MPALQCQPAYPRFCSRADGPALFLPAAAVGLMLCRLVPCLPTRARRRRPPRAGRSGPTVAPGLTVQRASLAGILWYAGGLTRRRPARSAGGGGAPPALRGLPFFLGGGGGGARRRSPPRGADLTAHAIATRGGSEPRGGGTKMIDPPSGRAIKCGPVGGRNLFYNEVSRGRTRLALDGGDVFWSGRVQRRIFSSGICGMISIGT